MEIRLGFRPGVSIVDAASGTLLQVPARSLAVTPLPHPVFEALAGGASEDALHDLARAADGPRGTARLHFALVECARLGLLRHTLVDNAPLAAPLAAIETFRGERLAALPAHRLEPGTRYRLSRFAVCRREGDELVVESPLARARMMLCSPHAAAVIGLLVVPRTVEEIARLCPALTQQAIAALVEWLVGAELTAATHAAEDVAPGETWRPEDLLFHARSRMGLSFDFDSGGTFRFRRTIAPLPARKPPMSDTAIALARPDGDVHDGRPFVEVLHRRRAAAAPNGRPIAVRQLSEFLYRSARVRSIVPIDDSAGRFYETTRRPYPNGGAAYDVELYPIVSSCDGVPPGLYHYDPFAHALEPLAGFDNRCQELLSTTIRSVHLTNVPPVLIAMTSRFQRRSWKYAGIAYANGLKGAGVLQETMVLVAADMELCGHAVAAEGAGRFVDLTGLDPEVEGLVGGVLLAAGLEQTR